MESKKCSKCKEVKSFDEYSKNKSRPDGRNCYCRPCMRAYKSMRDQRPSVKEARRAYQRSSYKDNPEASRKRADKWKSKNKDRLMFHNNKRRAARLKRTPSWANEQLIAAYYKEAKRLQELTGIEFHVDHIVPLQGELVSGLHVENNLQLLMAHENLGKSNKFDPVEFCA